MRRATLQRRSLQHHWRTNLAIVLGVAAGSAALTGALLVGDSLRGSLRDVAIGRLGPVVHALRSGRFFPERLADDIARQPGFVERFGASLPMIQLPGGVTHADKRTRVERITVLGVDDRFWAIQVGQVLAPASPTASSPLVWSDAPKEASAQASHHTPRERFVVLNQPLADELGARPGDDVLVQLGKPQTIAAETVLGRRDDTTARFRLTVQAIIPAEGLGGFGLSPQHAVSHNAFIPLGTLQDLLDQEHRINTVLVTQRAAGFSPRGPSDGDNTANDTDVGQVERSETCRENGTIRSGPRDDLFWLQWACENSATLADVGLKLRIDRDRRYVALESDSLLLEPAVERAAVAAAAIGTPPSSILTYLANKITVADRPGVAIPYSTVAALDASAVTSAPLMLTDGSAAPPLSPGEIYLNQWTADALRPTQSEPRPSGSGSPGLDVRIELSFYASTGFGQLETKTEKFILKGVVAMTPGAVDSGFAPEYPDVTDTENIADWDPPFPIDLKAISDRDEVYWDRYRAAPKAFIALSQGQSLWAQDAERFGRLTSVRIAAPDGGDADELARRFGDAILKNLDVSSMGLKFEPVRRRAIEAAAGTTDFGGLFIGFSFFLIVASGMLVALLFRLAVERRARDLGLMLAVGFTPASVTRMLLGEGFILAALGGGIGLLAASGYAWLMLAGLRTRWSGAANAPFLKLHVSATSFVIGYVASLAVALISIAWSLRGLTRRSPCSLLAGVVEAGTPWAGASLADAPSLEAGSPLMGAPSLQRWGSRIPAAHVPQLLRRHAAPITSAVALLAAVVLLILFSADTVPAATTFFGVGVSVLVASLAWVKHTLNTNVPRAIVRPGWAALAKLGIRNARRHPGRTMLTVGLIASATFVIASLQAFRIDIDARPGDKHSASGGFTLYAESALPLQYDLNTPAGRDALNVSAPTQELLAQTTVIPFRLRPGDASGCRNLYKPVDPRILGATDAMTKRGGFVFSSTLADNEAERENPWQLLRRDFPDGAVPTIADEASVLWQLHSGLGKDFVMTDERGRDVRLRFVALLKGSALQDELVIAEDQFTRLFPSISGYGFFLIDLPAARSDELSAALERELTSFGFDVADTVRRLADYAAVQNTYLSTFQTLGGLGLILGTIGLTAVMLRNVWERRGELALMRAVGFSVRGLGWMVLVENAALVVAGLTIGTVAAAVAVAPHVVNRSENLPWLSLVVILAGVFLTAMLSGVAALIPTLRAPLLPALRSE